MSISKQLIKLDPVKDLVKQKLLEKYDTTEFINTSSIKLELDIKDILNEYMDTEHIVEPRICILPEAYIKMRKLVDDMTTEVGWYGTVDEMPGLNTYVITDIIVYPQKVTGATCEQDEDRMFEFEMSLTDDQVNHKRFHGHSHVNMTTGPSSVDENFYADILKQVPDYFIITITNKRNEYTTRFYDIRNNIVYTGIPIEVIDNNGNPIDDWYDTVIKEVEEPVKVYSPVPKSTPSKSTKPNIYDDFYDEYDEAYYERMYSKYYDRDTGIFDNKKKKGKK